MCHVDMHVFQTCKDSQPSRDSTAVTVSDNMAALEDCENSLLALHWAVFLLLHLSFA